MNLLDKIFFINLDEKLDRKEHFYKQCEIHNIPMDKVERYSAINGQKHTFTKDELDMFKNNILNTELLTPYIVKKKIMGNQLSHYNILKEMINRNYNYILICQDDVMFRNNFVNYIDLILKDIPNDSEIINIGMHKKAVYDYFEPYDLTNEMIDINIIDKKKTDFVYTYKNINPETGHIINPNSLAYIVTKKGCNNLVDHFIKNGFYRETDWNFYFYLNFNKIIYGSKIILATGNNKFNSDVFVNTYNYRLEDLIDVNFYYTDKNTIHSYFTIYNELFSPIRETSNNILEIGIGNFNIKNGGSLLLWHMYFNNALINGIDIISNDQIYDVILKNNKIKTYTNTYAYSTEIINNFKTSNILFDVIIYDKSHPHTLESQCKCIELYVHLLNETGILVIEDVQDILWVDKFKEITPLYLHKYIHIYDLRSVKNRYDDILFVINKNQVNLHP